MKNVKKRRFNLGVALLMLLALPAVVLSAVETGATAAAPSTQPAAESTAPFQAYPSEVALSGSRGKQTIICRFTQPDGVTRDLTANSKFTIADANIAKMIGNVVAPVGDGSMMARPDAEPATEPPPEESAGAADAPDADKPDIV